MKVLRRKAIDLRAKAKGESLEDRLFRRLDREMNQADRRSYNLTAFLRSEWRAPHRHHGVMRRRRAPDLSPDLSLQH